MKPSKRALRLRYKNIIKEEIEEAIRKHWVDQPNYYCSPEAMKLIDEAVRELAVSQGILPPDSLKNSIDGGR